MMGGVWDYPQPEERDSRLADLMMERDLLAGICMKQEAEVGELEGRCERLVELIDLMRPLLPRPTLMEVGARADARRRVDELMVELGLMEGGE